MAEPKYDGRDARGILGACSEQLHPTDTRRAKRDAALELFKAFAALEIPGVKIVLPAAGRPLKIGVAPGRGPFGDPLFDAEVDYDLDRGVFRIAANGSLEHFALAYDHAEQRFEADAEVGATEEQRKRSALSAIARKIVSMLPTK
jgi:hypothetical protein